MSQRHKTPKSTRNHHHDPHHDGIDDCVATPSNLQVSLHKFVSIYLLKQYNALFLVDCCYLRRISIQKMVCRVRRGAAAANVRRFVAFCRFSSLFCAFFCASLLFTIIGVGWLLCLLLGSVGRAVVADSVKLGWPCFLELPIFANPPLLRRNNPLFDDGS